MSARWPALIIALAATKRPSSVANARQCNFVALSPRLMPAASSSRVFLDKDPCWCTRILVLSSEPTQQGTSNFLATAHEIRPHRPDFAHRAQRLYTVCHRPSERGSSRQGDPVRMIHIEAPTNRRSCFPGRPRFDRRFASWKTIRCHRASVKNRRLVSSMGSVYCRVHRNA